MCRLLIALVLLALDLILTFPLGRNLYLALRRKLDDESLALVLAPKKLHVGGSHGLVRKIGLRLEISSRSDLRLVRLLRGLLESLRDQFKCLEVGQCGVALLPELPKVSGRVHCAREVIAVNEALGDTPEIINTDPYNEGWIYKIRVTDVSELDNLMSGEEYDAQVAAEH